MTVLGVAHDLARHGGLAAKRAAELADDPMCASVKVDVLAGERSATAIGTAMPVGLQGADAAAQKKALELLDMAGGRSHLPEGFAHSRPVPAPSSELSAPAAEISGCRTTILL